MIGVGHGDGSFRWKMEIQRFLRSIQDIGTERLRPARTGPNLLGPPPV